MEGAGGKMTSLATVAMVQGEMMVSMEMDKSKELQSIFWRQNKWTLLMEFT